MKIPDPLRDVIGTGPLAHVSTINPDGSPQVSVVWLGLDGDELVVAQMDDRQRLRNLRRDARVAISFLGPVTNEWGLREHAVIYGRGRISDGGAADLLQRLARVYLGPDVVFPPEPFRQRPGFILHVTPERITGVGPWAGS
jgi:PPOX class probable F420-dependent enzyme